MARFATAQRKTARSEMTQYRDALTGSQWQRQRTDEAVGNRVEQKAIFIRKLYTNMVNRCVAAGCSNVATDNISVFTFPFDVNLRRKWVAAVRQNRRGWDGPGTAAVLCSAHFTADSIETRGVLEARMTGKRTKKHLVAGAVPTIFPRASDAGEQISKRPRTAVAKRAKMEVNKQ